MKFKSVHISRDFLRDRQRVFFLATDSEGHSHVATSFSFERITPGGEHSGFNLVDRDGYPTGTNEDWLQSLVNAAWDAGIRPVQSTHATQGALYHLEDMRRLVFRESLPPVLPNS